MKTGIDNDHCLSPSPKTLLLNACWMTGCYRCVACGYGSGGSRAVMLKDGCQEKPTFGRSNLWMLLLSSESILRLDPLSPTVHVWLWQSLGTVFPFPGITNMLLEAFYSHQFSLFLLMKF